MFALNTIDKSVKWAQVFGGSNGTDRPFGMTIDQSTGNVIVSGYYRSSDWSFKGAIVPVGTQDGFLLALNDAGARLLISTFKPVQPAVS